MSDNIFNKRKKKKLIKDIMYSIEVVSPFEIDKNIFDKYSYATISKLLPEDYNGLSEESLLEKLDEITVVGERLQSIRYNLYGIDTKRILNTKEDYINFDKLCATFDDITLSNYIKDNKITSIKDVTINDINNYLKEQKEYEEEHDKTRISEFLKENISEYNEANLDFIKTYTDAETLVKILKYMKENGTYSYGGFSEKSFINTLKRYSQYELFEKISIIFKTIKIDTLSEEQKQSLNDYISFNNEFPICKIETIDSIDKLNNYEKIKQQLIEKEYLYPTNVFLTLLSPQAASKLEGFYNQFTDMKYIHSISNDILENELGIPKEEIEVIKILATMQKITANSSSEEKNEQMEAIYMYIKNNDIKYKNIDADELLIKIMKIYGYAISKSLTKMSDMSDIKLIETKEEVPIYEKEEGNFRFLVHVITENHILNQTIEETLNGDHLYYNPSLWDNFPKEKGTVALSTSYISETQLPMIDSGYSTIIYGFDELEPSDVRNISTRDGATSHETNLIDSYGGAELKMVFPEKILREPLSEKNKHYNEVAFKRYAPNGERKKPNFILCFEDADEQSIKHAKYHNVPVLVIKSRKYLEEIGNKILIQKNQIKTLDKNNLNLYLSNLKELLYLMNCYLSFPAFRENYNFKIASLDEEEKISEEIKKVEEELNKENYSSRSRAFINSTFWIIILISIMLFITIWILYINYLT